MLVVWYFMNRESYENLSNVFDLNSGSINIWWWKTLEVKKLVVKEILEIWHCMKGAKEKLAYKKSEEWVWPWWCYSNVIASIWKIKYILCGIVILIKLMN